jgi:acetoin utilization deacetylase AcuC-like enzyme
VRYCSLHQLDIFPLSGKEKNQGPLNNLRSIGVLPFSTYQQYEPLLDRALQFLSEPGVFEPDLLIVCAGFDALASDPMAGVSLEPADYGAIAKKIRETFGDLPVVYGMEGGYNLEDLPLAVEQTLLAYAVE